MKEYRYIGKGIPRVDAKQKVTGETKYPSDVSIENQLYLKILRSKYPSAKIISIDTTEAEKLEGVYKILTHKDVPGLNGFGIAVQDQPVLCSDRVRYQGDAIALIGAETDALARKAADLINVEYEPLPALLTPEEAIKPNAPKIHEQGNILNEKSFKRGDVEKAFNSSDIVLEEVFTTQRQAHAYLETESGMAYYDENNKLTIHVGGQYPHRDASQIARILNIPEEEIRVINSPLGGGFGGKDELTTQAYVALMTYITKRPSKILIDREESFISYGKRHPMTIKIKMGANKDGKLTALQFNALGDTGAYASLGGPILNLTVEHAGSVYYFPISDVNGKQVYTNSGYNVAFRGFGVPQSLFAVESMMDRLADKLNIDPLRFREINLLEKGQLGVLDNDYPLTIGSAKIVEKMLQSDLLKDKEELKKSKHPDFKRGIGISLGFQGAGLGVGLPDFAHTRLVLQPNGKFKLYAGSAEMGQGNTTCFIQIAAENMHCEIENFDYIIGDSGCVPDSGSATASRTIYAVGASVYYASKRMYEQLLSHFNTSSLTIENNIVCIDGKQRISLSELAKIKAFESTGEFIVPISKQCLGDGLPHILYGYSGHVALVEINTKTGEVDVLQGETYLDAGTVVNQQGLEAQSEGGFVMGVGYALTENSIIEDGYYKNPRFSTYILPTAMDVPPKIKTIAVDIFEDTCPFGAKGIGEIVFTAVAPAITNAIRDAIGQEFNHLPCTPENILLKLQQTKEAAI